MGEFNSDDHCIYSHGKESLRRNGTAPHSQEKSVKCSTWVSEITEVEIKSFQINTMCVYV